MFQFVFLCGDNLELLNKMRIYASETWGNFYTYKLNEVVILTSSKSSEHLSQSGKYISCLAGYVTRDHLSHREVDNNLSDNTGLAYFSRHLIAHPNPWPLGSEWGGSFSAITYNDTDKKIALCNDVIGWHPLYYAIHQGRLVGGTNIYILGKLLGNPFDLAGLVERLYFPGCNYGRRTPIQGISRLLPGEFVWMNLDGRILERNYDNSLYNGIIKGDVREIASEIWNTLRKEVQDVVSSREQIHIGLGGGWDARLVLAAIDEMSDRVTAWTYGDEGEYEVKIARQVAQLAGVRFELCPLSSNNFQTRDVMEDVIRRTERVDYAMWFSVIERLGPRTDELFLLGDHTESIVGRNIVRYATRKSKQNLRYLMANDLDFTQTTYPRFLEWRNNKIATILAAILEKVKILPAHLQSQVNLAELSEQIRYDLEEDVNRIEGHIPYYTELFDELWVWYHYNRYYVIGQNRHVGYTVEAVSPNLSFRFLRHSSKIHPSLRATRRLMDTLGLLPALKEYGKIPAGNIPWFGNQYPTPFRNVVWAARSKMDQLLMKRVMRSRNPKGRQRVVKAIDYLAQWLDPSTLPRLESWFSGDWVDGKPFLDLARDRKNMEAWPADGADIVSAANVSILLDLIYNG